MYVLKKASLLENQLLQHRLDPFCYCLYIDTVGLRPHKTSKISFTLVVDEFAVKYVVTENAHHLHNALLCSYEITTDWVGTVYSGMKIKWDDPKFTCHISMPVYVTNVLNKLHHNKPYC